MEQFKSPTVKVVMVAYERTDCNDLPRRNLVFWWWHMAVQLYKAPVFFPATSCSSLATSKIIDSPLSKVPTPEYQTLIQIQKGPPPTSSAFSLQANRKDAWSKKKWTNLLQKPH